MLILKYCPIAIPMCKQSIRRNGVTTIPRIHQCQRLFFNLLFLRFFLGFFFKRFSVYIFTVWYFYAPHIHLPGNDIGD